LRGARKLALLTRLAREKEIRYIFFEVLASPSLAETIAREVGAETLVLNPLGGLTREETEAGETYISIMEANLKNLRLALECE
jgi:zinc transport system substrate-binding protein